MACKAKNKYSVTIYRTKMPTPVKYWSIKITSTKLKIGSINIHVGKHIMLTNLRQLQIGNIIKKWAKEK
jgi:hypothetical protein